MYKEGDCASIHLSMSDTLGTAKRNITYTVRPATVPLGAKHMRCWKQGTFATKPPSSSAPPRCTSLLGPALDAFNQLRALMPHFCVHHAEHDGVVLQSRGLAAICVSAVEAAASARHGGRLRCAWRPYI